MPLRPEARGWFERAVFDLSIAQAHLESGIWLDAGKHARQAAVKFLQAAIVQKGEPHPSPRAGDLAAAVKEAFPGFTSEEDWRALDAVAAATAMTQDEARSIYHAAERVRDGVAAALK